MYSFTSRWEPGPGPVAAPGGSGPGIVVSCTAHRRLPLAIAQARVHPARVEWVPTNGWTAHTDAQGAVFVQCPVHGQLAVSAQQVASAANRVRRRFRSVGRGRRFRC